MSWKQRTAIAALAIIALLTYLGWKLTARSAYETANYRVIETEGRFEIREYPDLTLASTSMQLESQGDDGSFMRLFRYISGANDQEQKIAMTTPVFMETAASDDQGQMGFVLPKEVSSQRVPKPSHQDVLIRQRSGGRFAAVRFAGRMSSESMTVAKRELRQWMNKRGLISDGDAESASYDPPWTPGPLRRNEAVIRIK